MCTTPKAKLKEKNRKLKVENCANDNKSKRDIYPVGGYPSLSNLPLIVAEVAAAQKYMNAYNNNKLSFIIHSLSLSLLKIPLTNEKKLSRQKPTREIQYMKKTLNKNFLS